MVKKAGDYAPHGGQIVMPVIDNPFLFIVAVLIGIGATAFGVNALKKIVTEGLLEGEDAGM